MPLFGKKKQKADAVPVTNSDSDDSGSGGSDGSGSDAGSGSGSESSEHDGRAGAVGAEDGSGEASPALADTAQTTLGAGSTATGDKTVVRADWKVKAEAAAAAKEASGKGTLAAARRRAAEAMKKTEEATMRALAIEPGTLGYGAGGKPLDEEETMAQVKYVQRHTRWVATVARAAREGKPLAGEDLRRWREAAAKADHGSGSDARPHKAPIGVAAKAEAAAAGAVAAAAGGRVGAGDGAGDASLFVPGGAIESALETLSWSRMHIQGRYKGYRIKSKHPVAGTQLFEDRSRKDKALTVAKLEAAIKEERRLMQPTHRARRQGLAEYERAKFETSHGVLIDRLQDVVSERETTRLQYAAYRKADMPTDPLLFKLIRRGDWGGVARMFAEQTIANPNAAEPINQMTGLMKAASAGKAKIVQLFLENDADANQENKTGNVAIHYAWDAWLRVPKDSLFKIVKLVSTLMIVEQLCKHNANPNIPLSSEGTTPLHFAAAHGHAIIAQVLLKYHANPACRDDLGKLPLDYAEQNDHREVAGLLRNWPTISRHIGIAQFRASWGTWLASGEKLETLDAAALISDMHLREHAMVLQPVHKVPVVEEEETEADIQAQLEGSTAHAPGVLLSRTDSRQQLSRGSNRRRTSTSGPLSREAVGQRIAKARGDGAGPHAAEGRGPDAGGRAGAGGSRPRRGSHIFDTAAPVGEGGAVAQGTVVGDNLVPFPQDGSGGAGHGGARTVNGAPRARGSGAGRPGAFALHVAGAPAEAEGQALLSTGVKVGTGLTENWFFNSERYHARVRHKKMLAVDWNREMEERTGVALQMTKFKDKNSRRVRLGKALLGATAEEEVADNSVGTVSEHRATSAPADAGAAGAPDTGSARRSQTSAPPIARARGATTAEGSSPKAAPRNTATLRRRLLVARHLADDAHTPSLRKRYTTGEQYVRRSALTSPFLRGHRVRVMDQPSTAVAGLVLAGVDDDDDDEVAAAEAKAKAAADRAIERELVVTHVAEGGDRAKAEQAKARAVASLQAEAAAAADAARRATNLPEWALSEDTLTNATLRPVAVRKRTNKLKAMLETSIGGGASGGTGTGSSGESDMVPGQTRPRSRQLAGGLQASSKKKPSAQELARFVHRAVMPPAVNKAKQAPLERFRQEQMQKARDELASKRGSKYDVTSSSASKMSTTLGRPSVALEDPWRYTGWSFTKSDAGSS